MLGSSETVSQELPLAHRVGIRSCRNRKNSDGYRTSRAKQNQLNYSKRKAARLCTQGLCPEKTQEGHTHCKRHLLAMSRRAEERCNERIARGLCILCGKRPQFWGQKCIICRRAFAKDPLPRGARRALHIHREGEKRGSIERRQSEAREAALELLASKRVAGKCAQALRLYVGLDNGSWRTYREVGAVMKVSTERVRQLLLPSKLNLYARLSGRVPWVPLEQDESNGDCQTHEFPLNACTICNDIALKIIDQQYYPYEDCILPNVVLFGLPIEYCQNCRGETVSVPRISDLHIELAKAVLSKPAALTGQELRFLNTVTGLSRLAFAEQLGVTMATILRWEKTESLRYLNDLGARMVVAALIAPNVEWSSILSILSSIKMRGPVPDRVSALWSNQQARWVVNSPI